MSTGLKRQIAKWFFLIIGIAGVSFFTYLFYATDKYAILEWLLIISVFSVFIFKPTILPDVFEHLMGKRGSNGT